MSPRDSILVVDPDHTITALIVEVLSDERYGVQTAQAGARAPSAAAASRRKLVLLDMHIPRKDVSALIADLRHICGATISIVLMSTSPGGAQALLGDGIPTCLAK